MGVEQEIIDATGFNPRKKYDERQDYLAALLLSTKDLSDEQFDDLSDEARDWINDNAKLRKSKKDLADFEDGEEADTNGEKAEANEEIADDEADDDEADDSVVGVDEEADEGDPTDDNPEEDEPEEKSAKKPAKKAAKPAKEAKPEKAAKKADKPAPKAKAKTKGPTAADVELDKYGVMVGSQTHQVLKRFEKGCTMSDVKKEFGGTHYNKLKQLVKDGHHVHKEDGVITLIHKDEYGAKAKGKKK